MKPKDYPYSVLEEKINSTEVSIVGVSHSEKSLDKYKKFLEEKITESDAIMLEQPVGRNFWDSPFFGGLGEIAHSQGKKVYQADAVNLKALMMDLTQWAFSIYTACFSGLKLAYAIPAGAYLFLGSLAGMFICYTPLIYSKRGEKLLTTVNDYAWLFYGETDHRNIKIAEGIENICSKVEDVKRLACFHGELHLKPVRTYLKNPVFRKIKKTLYLPTYEFVSESKVREYIPVKGGWELSRKF